MSPIERPPRRTSAFRRPSVSSSDAPASGRAAAARGAGGATGKGGRARGFLSRTVSIGRRSGRRVTMTMSAFVACLVVAVVVLGPPAYNLVSVAHERHQLAAELAQARATHDALDAELKKWQDPRYLSAQARERLGYVDPGEVRYTVVDPGPQYEAEDGNTSESDRPWFLAIADSVVAADKSGTSATSPDGRRGRPADGATEVPREDNK